MATVEFKLPGEIVDKTPQELLPLTPESLTKAEVIMAQLQESQRHADELARRTIIRAGTGAMAIELAQAESKE